MGRNKIYEEVAGEVIINRVIARLALINSEIMVVTASGQELPAFAPYLKINRVLDIYPGKGSLGGVYTGVALSTSFHSLVVACDMPFLNSALLRYIISLSENYDVVVPRVAGKLEPLHAVYSRNCLAPMERLLKRDELRIAEFFNTVKVRYVEDSEIDAIDSQHLSFFNINSEEDLIRANELTAEIALDAS